MYPIKFQDLSAPNKYIALGFQSREMMTRNIGDHQAREEAPGRTTTKLCSRGHWRPAEDAKLKELIAELGPQNWNLIAEQLPGRSGKSCRLRWCNQLDPRINKKPFAEEEEAKLLAAHRLYGNKWSLIAKLFPGRTDNAVKNHWHVVMSRRQREQNSLYNRKRKAASSFNAQVVLSRGKDVSTSNANACSETTNSSTIDESGVSTCTLGAPCTYLGLNPVHNLLYNNGHQMGMIELTNRGDEKFHGTGHGFYNNGKMGRIMMVGQSVQSDSNSEEVSAAESVSTNNNSKNNLSVVAGKDGNGNENINMPFIDFLGVGDS